MPRQSLYEEMGRQFEPKYFQSAIDTYNFLLKQYPGSRYRAEAIIPIGQIQKEDLIRRILAGGDVQGILEALP